MSTTAALAALLLLAACQPLSGGPPRTAALPDKPTVPVDNPFYCPKATAP
jgi:hypothetical protein